MMKNTKYINVKYKFLNNREKRLVQKEYGIKNINQQILAVYDPGWEKGSDEFCIAIVSDEIRELEEIKYFDEFKEIEFIRKHYSNYRYAKFITVEGLSPNKMFINKNIGLCKAL